MLVPMAGVGPAARDALYHAAQAPRAFGPGSSSAGALRPVPGPARALLRLEAAAVAPGPGLRGPQGRATSGPSLGAASRPLRSFALACSCCSRARRVPPSRGFFLPEVPRVSSPCFSRFASLLAGFVRAAAPAPSLAALPRAGRRRLGGWRPRVLRAGPGPLSVGPRLPPLVRAPVAVLVRGGSGRRSASGPVPRSVLGPGRLVPASVARPRAGGRLPRCLVPGRVVRGAGRLVAVAGAVPGCAGWAGLVGCRAGLASGGGVAAVAVAPSRPLGQVASLSSWKPSEAPLRLPWSIPDPCHCPADA